MRTLVAAVVAACSIAILIASPQDEKKNSAEARVVVVEGCVDGSRLTVKGKGPAAHTDRYILRTNKDLKKVITRDLKGHRIEVTGTLIDPDNTQGTLKTVPVGKKTTITTGMREVSNGPAEPVREPEIDVSSVRDVEKVCR